MADDGFGEEGSVRTLIGRAAYIADEGAIAQYKEVYTDDVVWEMGDQRQEGVDSIIDSAIERRASGLGGPGSFTRHFVVPVDVRFTSPSDAVSVTYVSYLTSTDTTPVISLVATYTDELRREAGGWRISHRTVNRG